MSNVTELRTRKVLPLKSQPRLMADLCSVMSRHVYDGNTLTAGEKAYELFRYRMRDAIRQHLANPNKHISDTATAIWFAIFPEDAK